MQRRQTERRTRRRRPLWWRLVLALILLIVLDLVLAGISAAMGGYEALQIQKMFRGGNLGSSLASLSSQQRAVHDDLDVANRAFSLARVFWWPWRPAASGIASLIHPARVLAQVSPLLDLGVDGTVLGLHGLDAAAPLLRSVGHAQSAGSDMVPRLVAALQQAHGALQTTLPALMQVDHDLSALDMNALPAQVRKPLTPLPHPLSLAEDGLRLAIVAPGLLGAHGARHYLVVPENPWDLRGSGGFVGTTALLDVTHGTISLSGFQDSKDVDASRQSYAPPPLPMISYQHRANLFYRDANWSPDFPTSAALLRYFYWVGNRKTLPDGVVAFDSSLLPTLLEITGPVSVPGIAELLNPATAVQILDRYVNAVGTGNKSIAGLAYSIVFARLRHLPTSILPTALHVLRDALQQRHLLVWIPDAVAAPILARHAWDGAIDPTSADYFYVTDTNVHDNKINQLITEGIAYRAVIQPDHSLQSSLTLAYTNTATLALLPKPQNNTLYEDFVRVYAPLGSQLIRVSGLTQRWTTIRAHNKTMFQGYLRVRSLAHRTVTVTYRVPPNALLDPAAYHLTVQKQPGTGGSLPHIPLSIDVRVRPGTPGLSINGGARWSWRGERETDLRFSIPLSGGIARPIPLAYDTASAPVITPGGEVEPGLVLSAGLPRLP